MKNGGTLIRTFAIILVAIIFVGAIANWALGKASRDESWKERKEYVKEHKEDAHDGKTDKDCEFCKTFKKEEKTHNRQEIQYVVSAILGFAQTATLCGMMYGFGALIESKKAKTTVATAVAAAAPAPAPVRTPAPTPAPAPAPKAPTATFCPKCGAKQQDGARFCPSCGNAIEQ